VIDNMPLDDLSELDNEQKRRITLMTQKGKFAEDGAAISALLGEVNNDFKRTMCKIILDLEIDKTPNLLGFTMPRRPDPPETRERDLLPLEREKGVLEIILKSPKEKYPMVPRSFKQLRN
jgi:dynein heavy chain, axonemal